LAGQKNIEALKIRDNRCSLLSRIFLREIDKPFTGRAVKAALPLLFFLLLLQSPVYAECKDIYVFNAERIIKDKGGLFLDVRQAHEYKDCHIPGSINIPIGEIEKRYTELDKDTPIVIYCRTAQRSGGACSLLDKKGVKNVYNLVGGIAAWYNTGRVLEGKCEGKPYFKYDSKGNVVSPELKSPIEEPDIKGCK